MEAFKAKLKPSATHRKDLIHSLIAPEGNESPSSLMCLICWQTAYDPVYCKACLTALYCGACCNKMKQKCPKCRKVGASFKRPNRILRRFMDGVRVACGKCGLRDLNYGDAEEHIQECGVYRIDCLLGCGMVLSGVKEAAEHWEKCPANLTECMVCKSKYNVTDMASHDCRAKLLSKIN